jgi:hypothetical protein
MLFISTGIFDDKLRPQILSVVPTVNAPLNKKNKLIEPQNVLLLSTILTFLNYLLDIYRIIAVTKVETDIIASIAANLE